MKTILILMILGLVGCAKSQDGPSEAELEASLPSCDGPELADQQSRYKIFYGVGPNYPTISPPFRFICKDQYTDSSGAPKAVIIFAKDVESSLDGYIYFCPNNLDGTCYQKARAFIK